MRKAREQVKLMELDGFSTQKIRLYLSRWTTWWASTSEIWQYSELLVWQARSCWDIRDAVTSAALLAKHTTSNDEILMGLAQQNTHLQH